MLLAGVLRQVNKKEGATYAAAPWLFALGVSLELEAHGPLYLAFAEERAASGVHGLERGVVNQRCRPRERRRAVDARRGSGGGVNLRIRTGNLSAIEEVK